MPSAPITSFQNETVKLIRSLADRKARRETGLFVSEGAEVIGMAKAAGHAPEMLVHGPGTPGPADPEVLDWAGRAGARLVEVTRPILEKLAGRDNPQSLIGVFRQRPQRLPEPPSIRRSDLWIALEEVRDPGNLGTILRTADAAGARGLLLVGPSCDPYAPDCVHAAMGSIFNVPHPQIGREAFLHLAKGWPGDIAALIVGATEDIRRARLEEPVLLLMGREGPGLGAELAAVATRRLAIPMAGRAQSLNLAVATAIAVYQVRASHLSV
jgi:TrmH family RNA methyltransferase